MVLDAYLGFRIGDVVLDLAELTAGTAVIKEFKVVASDHFSDMAVVAVMENGAERYVTQLKRLRPEFRDGAPAGGTVVPMRRRGG